MSTKIKRDCEQLGLTKDQLASLTGFTHRAWGALAHLREAWCVADRSNRPGVEHAIKGLCATRSLKEKPTLVAATLGFGFDIGLADEIRHAAGLAWNGGWHFVDLCGCGACYGERHAQARAALGPPRPMIDNDPDGGT